jgi:hypothetical protein
MVVEFVTKTTVVAVVASVDVVKSISVDVNNTVELTVAVSVLLWTST